MTKARDAVAIVGIGCRLPGGLNTPEELWAALLEGRDCMRSVPADRWDARRFYDPNPSAPGKMIVREAGFLSQRLDEFDAHFFNISPREAEQIDPQQRILLEVSWEAFEDAGLVPGGLRGSNTGVFIGGFFSDMTSFRYGPLARSTISAQTATAASHTMLSARLSYFYDLRGPAFTVDTACSSSLVAIHQACQSLISGECDLALAGGVSVMLLPEPGITCSKGGFLSPDARSKSFDQGANGYARGEGGVVFVLELLEDARRAGHRVHAVISATGVNQDGFTNGITVPNGEAQRQLIARTLANSGIDQSQLRYIEAHGTGTPVGDPIEIRALASAIGQRPPEGPCYVGSIKSNFGHLEGAAGAAGVLKAALCLSHRAIPPNLHFVTPNKAIDFEAARFEVPTRVIDLGAARDTIRAGVNSFGYGGTNAFAVLSEDSAGRAEAQTSSPDQLGTTALPVLLSARTVVALRALCFELIAHLRRRDVSQRLVDIAHTLSQHRTHHEHRLAVFAKSRDEAASKLEAWLAAQSASPYAQARVLDKGSHRVVFVYTGMGPQWAGMARGLLESEPVFRKKVEECDHILRKWADWSLVDELLAPEGESRVTDVRIAQPANFAVQVGLTQLFAAYGVKPAALLGHSIGDVAAAHCCGALTLEEGLEVAFHRARLQHTRSGAGAMLAAGVAEEEALELVAQNPKTLSLAAVNGPASVTLAGDLTTLKRISAQLTFREVFNKFLKVDIAYHSYQMDGLRGELERELCGLMPQTPVIPYVSTVTGDASPGPLDAGYWWRNMRDAVQFERALKVVLRDGPAIFVEVGPHPVLSASIQAVLRELRIDGTCVPSLVRGMPQHECHAESIGALHAAGFAIDWRKVLGDGGTLVGLPRYAWDRKKYWLENEASRQDRLDTGRHPLLARRLEAARPEWEAELGPYTFAYLVDHVVNGSTLVPGALFIEAGLAIARDQLGQTAIALANLEFHEALAVPHGAAVLQRVTYDPEGGGFSVYGRQPSTDEWRLCATGNLRHELGLHEGEVPDIEELLARATCEQTGDVFYEACQRRGLNYGPYFRCVQRLFSAEDWVLAEIIPGADFTDNDERYVVPACYLDAAFHSVVGIQLRDGPRGPVVPVGVDEVRVHHTPRGRVWSYATVRNLGDRTVTVDVVLFDDIGRVCVDVRGLRCSALTAAPHDSEVLADSLYCFTWVETPSPSSLGPVGARVPVIQVEPGLTGEAVALRLGESAASVARVSFGTGDGEPSAGEYRVRRDSSEDWARVFEVYRDFPELTVIYWVGAPSRSPQDSADIWSAAAQPVLDVAALVRACSAAGKDINLWLVTRGTQQVAGESVKALAGASLSGMARVVRTEQPNVRCRVLDLDPTDETPVELVARVLSETGGEVDLALRNGRQFAQRLQRLRFDDADMVARHSRHPGAERALELVEGRLGAGRSFCFREVERTPPGADEVEIALSSIAVDGEDVGPLLNRGMLPRRLVDGRSQVLVQAFGRVLARGSSVSGLPSGSTVYLPHLPFVRSLLSVRAADCVAPVTEQCFPADMALAIYAVEDVGRVGPSDRVVVFGADTRLGAAVATWAARLGCVVMAVADPGAHAVLSGAGVQAVAPAGRVDTRDAIAAWARDGQPSVMFACRSGEDVSASLSLLSSGGILVALAESEPQTSLALSLRGSFSYSRVDIPALTQDPPPRLKVALERALTALAEDPRLRAPALAFSFADEGARQELAAAHASEQSAHHAVIALDKGALSVQPVLSTTPVVVPGATYLVTGGLTGFGLETAKWLAARGATQLLLVSRSGARDMATRAEIDAISQRGCCVHVEAVDVADTDVFGRVIGTALERLPPLRGVIHSAMVLRDATLAQLSASDFRDVLRPKVLGAWNLHTLTKDMQLDFFVAYSSIASVLGAYGQSNYVAANAFVEQFALFRRSLGLPCQVSSWGALSEVGTVARDARIAEYLAKIGVTGLTNAQALAGLDIVLRSQLPYLGVMQVNWSEWARHNQNSPLCAGLLPRGPASLSGQKRSGMTDGEALEITLSTIARTLKLPRDGISETARLSNLGIDSLLAVEIVAAIEQEIGIRLPVSAVVDNASVSQLSNEILRRRSAREGAQIEST